MQSWQRSVISLFLPGGFETCVWERKVGEMKDRRRPCGSVERGGLGRSPPCCQTPTSRSRKPGGAETPLYHTSFSEMQIFFAIGVSSLKCSAAGTWCLLTAYWGLTWNEVGRILDGHLQSPSLLS